MDGEVITAMRTAAASAVATKYLAQRTQILSVLGCGTQARSHIDAFRQLFSFEKVGGSTCPTFAAPESSQLDWTTAWVARILNPGALDCECGTWYPPRSIDGVGEPSFLPSAPPLARIESIITVKRPFFFCNFN